MARFPTLTTSDPKGVQAWSSQLVRSLDRQINSLGLGVVTLSANTDSTTVSDQIAAPEGAVLMIPTSASAAGMMIMPYVPPETILDGSFVIQHESSPSGDRAFAYVIFEPEGNPVA